MKRNRVQGQTKRHEPVEEPVSLKKSRSWFALWAFSGFSAATWFWLMPQGFPLGSVHWWANTAPPVMTVALSIVGIVALARRRIEIAQPIMLAISVAWTASLLTACALFPISCQRFSLPVVFLAVVFWLAYWKQSPARTLASRGMLVAGVLAVAVGIGLPFTQLSPAADTSPLNEMPPTRFGTLGERSSPSLVKVDEGVELVSTRAEVRIKCNHLNLDILPLLKFVSRSPDRCWSNLAPSLYGSGPERLFSGMVGEGNNTAYLYRDDASHWLQVHTLGEKRGASIESFTQLPNPIYSHLNSYSIVQIDGHKDLRMSFSPCPETQISVETSDYPVGRPARFAYLDAAGQFTVVEASSGEKGPFQTLASGKLNKTEELRIGLYDEGKLVGTVVFVDWASQLSTSLSPTAGWGVPANAIEFHRYGDDKKESITIWMALAATSVGRGWNTVGHREGVYRNRMRIEVEPGPPKAKPVSETDSTGTSKSASH